MNRLVLSICIPTYNRKDYLKECLDSIVCQFDDKDIYEKVEIVISDNNSDDGTENLVKDYQGKYKNIRYYKLMKTESIAFNWENTIKNSSGLFVNTIGDDDFYLQNSLVNILDFLKDNDSDIVSVAGYQIINDKNPKKFEYTKENFKIYISDIAEEYFSFGSRKIIIPRNFHLNPGFIFFRRIHALSIIKNKGSFWKEPIGDHWAIFSIASLSEGDNFITFFDFPVVAYRIHIDGHLAMKYNYQKLKIRLDSFLETSNTKFNLFPGYSFTNLLYVAMQDIKMNFSYYSKFDIDVSKGLYIHINDIFYCDLSVREKVKYIYLSLKEEKRGKVILFFRVCVRILFNYLKFLNFR